MPQSVRSTIYHCDIILLDKIHNRAGNITVVEGQNTVQFDLKRVYYLYDIPGGEDRGGHAHKELYQIIVAAAGAFDVLLDDGTNKKVVRLNRPDTGLLIVPGIWRDLMEFSSGAVALVLASDLYDNGDYIRDYNLFKSYKRGG